MVLTLLKRIVKEHSGAHLWAPIVVVVLLSLFLDVFLAGHAIEWRDWPGFWKPLLFDHWRELLSIYLAFTWIVWKSVRQASDVRWTMIGDLSDNLENADRYFAIGTIPLREWFEPNALVYLATIIRQQRERQQSSVLPQPNAFRHDRVLLFHKNADFKALQASYLDQHYARSFSAIHDRFDIGLAYLRPDELSRMFSELKPDERRKLGAYWWFARPRSLWRRKPLCNWAKNTTKPQPFSVIQKGQGRVILRFLKDGNSLAVEKIVDQAELNACEALVKLTEAAIYKPGGTELREHCKFSKYLCP